MIICGAAGQFVVVSSCREIRGCTGYCGAVSRILQLHLRAGASLLDYLSQAFLIRKYRVIQNLLQNGEAKIQLIIKHADACHKRSGKTLRICQIRVGSYGKVHAAAV